jgi:hypothetical protein
MLPPARIAFLSACLLTALTTALTISSPAKRVAVFSPVQVSLRLSGAQSGSILAYDGDLLIFRKRGGLPVMLTGGSHTIMVKAVRQHDRSSSATTTVIAPAPAVSSPFAPSSDVGTQIGADMTGTNEGFPHGVPLSYNWASGPAMMMGNNASGWRAMTAWGVVYVASQGNAATNTRVNIRRIRSYFMQKRTGKWLMLQNTSTPDGAAYLENFAGDTSKPGDVRTEPDGTISVTAGRGYNYHFYPSARATINPNDIGGLVTIFEARLIIGSEDRPDDRNVAAYLAGSGGDYYPAVTGGWPGNLSYNPGIAIGKEKYVKRYWRFFSMTTMTAAQLQSNPLPIDLTGIEP